MKKVYEQPDLKLLSFALTNDVLAPSIENNPTPGGGSLDDLDGLLGDPVTTPGS